MKMGCNDSKDTNHPTLLCFYEIGNDQQKEYCLKLKNNFRHKKTIAFSINSTPGVPFSIKFRVKNKSEPYKIQENTDYSDDAMNESLKKMYDILDKMK